MYRHFAALTIAATLTLALFSNGETREAAAREIVDHRTRSAATPTALQRRDDAAPVRHDGGGDGFDTAYGQPMDRVGATPQGTSLAFGNANPGNGLPVGFTQYGVSAEVWATLSPDQQKALMARRKAEQDAATAPDRKQQIDALIAASRARSGGTGAVVD